MKTVSKPWGKEIWLELNDKYCYKRIYINAGTRTSYQYHENKLETNYIIDGEAEVWLEDDNGIVEKKIITNFLIVDIWSLLYFVISFLVYLVFFQLLIVGIFYSLILLLYFCVASKYLVFFYFQ